MDKGLNAVLESIEQKYKTKIGKGSRHYLEVGIVKTAHDLGYRELQEKYADTCVIVPLKEPQPGMKVRIDGRTFVNYAQYDSGIAVPGHVARNIPRPYSKFVPEDSMICNFT
jgi:hypothetical protein